MSPPSLAKAERDAFAALLIDADDEAHRRWLAARDAIRDAILADGGRPLEDHATLGLYTVNRHGRLTRHMLYRGRLLAWSRSGAGSIGTPNLGGPHGR